VIEFGETGIHHLLGILSEEPDADASAGVGFEKLQRASPMKSYTGLQTKMSLEAV
jgi:hypothetical protein